ncbi:MAG: formylglycine-generating enzyme family protein [Myxococcales bacterium]|nr:formylglycine-generating enzyme family protein [Myxococcales bacterium]
MLREGRREARIVERFGLSWAETLGIDDHGVWAEVVGQRLRWISPGRFVMGSPEGEEGRSSVETPHPVVLTRGFWLGTTPVTQAVWTRIMGKNPSRFPDPERPVEQVSWTEAVRFCERLAERVPGLQPRLPTEAEWEYACRAGTRTATWAGDPQIVGQSNAPLLDDIAWYAGNSGHEWDLSDAGEDSSGWPDTQYDHTLAGTRRVGLKAPNPWGLYDMLGNVWEWCADAERRAYSDEEEVDPVSTTGRSRVLRGACWCNHAQCVRAAYRFGHPPGRRYEWVGFRLAGGASVDAAVHDGRQ